MKVSKLTFLLVCSLVLMASLSFAQPCPCDPPFAVQEPNDALPVSQTIAFGELFATIVVLYLVPVSYSLYWSAGGRFGVDDEEDYQPAHQPEPLPELTATV